MKLYEIPKNSKIRLTIGGPDREPKEEICEFKHVDGMYSLILTPDKHAVHLGRLTEVQLKDDVYEINPKEQTK